MTCTSSWVPWGKPYWELDKGTWEQCEVTGTRNLKQSGGYVQEDKTLNYQLLDDYDKQALAKECQKQAKTKAKAKNILQ